MKKRSSILYLLVTVIVLASCSSSKQARNYSSTINGNWTLQSVTTEGITGKIKAQLLNEASSTCFNGSSWKFNNNNNLGSYTINQNGSECPSINRSIRWSIYEPTGQPKSLQFKRLDEKRNEIDENKGGFRFIIVDINETSMKLKYEMTFEGKPAAFVYNFVKN
jgi:hypothetical protein